LVPLKYFRNKKKFDLLTTEIFGPVSIVTEYNTKDVSKVINCLEGMNNHLTAAVVSNDVKFVDKVLG